MPRPRKCRKVCRLPDNQGFLPILNNNDKSSIILQIDEYECIRLIDKEGFSQEQCGEYMHIARATVQQIYTNARKKLADAIVDGLKIQICGGDYRVCDGKEHSCSCGGCKRHNLIKRNSEKTTMKIAIPLNEDKTELCQVLARAPYFLFSENSINTIVENPASQAEGGAGVQVAQFLVDNKINVLITARCGQNAKDVFEESEIKIYKSNQKVAQDNLNAYQNGELEELTHFHGGYHGIQ